MNEDMILILDFGGPYTLSIAQKLRGESVFCEVMPYDVSIETVREKAPKGLLFVGGSEDAFSENAPRLNPGFLGLDLPLLGIGYGARALARTLGARPVDSVLDLHTASVELSPSPLFGELQDIERFFERVDILDYPQPLSPIARTADNTVVAFEQPGRRLYGLQFYPEQNDPDGLTILNNFACDICGCEPWWSMPAYIDRIITRIREEIGDGEALMAISGGIDSTVCAVLMHQAIGNRMHCLHIDTGLMRKGETELVQEVFTKILGIELISVDASERFLRRLKGVIDPTEKRRVIVEEFEDVFADEARKLPSAHCIVQGTIYSDIIKSLDHDDPVPQSSNIDVRFDGLLENTRLIEPTRMLFKNEVRQIGQIFGLPDALVHRQPFPLSGLAMRCLGEVSGYKLKLLREASDIFREEVNAAGLDKRIWQFFVVLTDIRSNSERVATDDYEYTVALRAVNRSGPAVTPYRLPYELLERVTARITTEVPGINRVVYDVTGNPPASIEWE